MCRWWRQRVVGHQPAEIIRQKRAPTERDPNPAPEPGVQIAEILPLERAPRGTVLGIEIDNDVLTPQILQADRLVAGRVGGEVGDDPVHRWCAHFVLLYFMLVLDRFQDGVEIEAIAQFEKLLA